MVKHEQGKYYIYIYANKWQREGISKQETWSGYCSLTTANLRYNYKTIRTTHWFDSQVKQWLLLLKSNWLHLSFFNIRVLFDEEYGKYWHLGCPLLEGDLLCISSHKLGFYKVYIKKSTKPHFLHFVFQLLWLYKNIKYIYRI